jgi:hypothetical protein
VEATTKRDDDEDIFVLEMRKNSVSGVMRFWGKGVKGFASAHSGLCFSPGHQSDSVLLRSGARVLCEAGTDNRFDWPIKTDLRFMAFCSASRKIVDVMIAMEIGER